MRIDLHCHSTFSDGSLAASEVAERAASFGVELFCLTDHDTTLGYAHTTMLASRGCRVLRGLELSCKEYGRTVHVLAYDLQEGPGLTALSERLDAMAEARRERLVRICERLDGLGVHLDAQALLARSHGRTPGRPDVGRALVAAGVCSSVQEAFTRFLRDGGPADVEIERLTVSEGLALCSAAGAKMSLAHPHTLREPALVRALFERVRAEGLEGIEAFYGNYGPAEREGWLRLARDLDLVVTGGSDFHGDITPHITRPGIELPEPYASHLSSWLGYV